MPPGRVGGCGGYGGDGGVIPAEAVDEVLKFVRGGEVDRAGVEGGRWWWLRGCGRVEKCEIR